MSTSFKPLMFCTAFTFISTLITGCGADQLDKDRGTTSKIFPKENLNINVNPPTLPKDEPKRKQIDLASECKKYIGEVMGRSPASMKVDHQREPGRLVGISYIRSNDGKKFSYECKTDGVSIVWRGVDIFASGDGPGRWRDEDTRPIAG